MPPSFLTEFSSRRLLLKSFVASAAGLGAATSITAQVNAPPALVNGKRRVLTLVNAPYPPFVNPGTESSEGIDVEIARLALAPAGIDLNVVLVPWKRALTMLKEGSAHLTTTISRNEEREQFLAFSDGYRSWVRYHFYTRKGSRLKLGRIEDLDGKQLGLTAGFFYPAAITNRPGLRAETGSDLSTTIRMLQAGRTELIVVNGVAGAWELRRLGLAKELQRLPFEYSSDSPTYMAFSKAVPYAEDLASLNKGLKALRADGTIERIEARYIAD